MSCHLKNQELGIQRVLSFSFSNSIVSINNLGGTSKKCPDTYEITTEMLCYNFTEFR